MALKVSAISRPAQTRLARGPRRLYFRALFQRARVNNIDAHITSAGRGFCGFDVGVLSQRAGVHDELMGRIIWPEVLQCFA